MSRHSSTSTSTLSLSKNKSEDLEIEIDRKITLATEGQLKNFDDRSLTLPEGRKPKWYFDIREDNERHYLKVRSPGTKEHNIDNYLNKWDQIEDFKPFYEGTYKRDSPNHWILVVTDKLEQNLTAKQILTTRMN